MDSDDLVKEFEKAQGIINGYGSILEKALAVPYGAPVSLLPYTKEEIKKAIKMAVLILKKVEPDPQKTIEQLKICYVQLANFIADDAAAVAAKAHDALNAGDPSKITPAETQQALNGVEQISQELKVLSQEFEDYVASLG